MKTITNFANEANEIKYWAAPPVPESPRPIPGVDVNEQAPVDAQA